MTFPLALANLGLIDEYEFIVHPRIIGRGPTLFAGLSKILDLNLVGRKDFASGDGGVGATNRGGRRARPCPDHTQ